MHYISKKTASFLFLLFFCLIGFSQELRLVKDINPDGHGIFSRSNDYYTAVSDKLFFVATDGIHGFELWSSDGTQEGTQMIKDISEGGENSDIHGLINHNGLCYFFADDGMNGKELWRSDGTEMGTYMIADINPGDGDAVFATFQHLTSAGGSIYFEAFNGDSNELWVVDENESASLFPGLPNETFHSGITGIYNMDEVLYFFRDITFDGLTLYSYDGNELTKIDELGLGNIITKIHDSNGILYYAVQQGFDDILWSYNSNTSINKMLFTPENIIHSAIAHDSKFLFSINDDPSLYMVESDATEATLLMETNFAFADEPSAFEIFNGYIYFYGESSNDGIHRTDCTVEGTELLFDIDKIFGDGSGIHAFGNSLLIAGENSFTLGEELFISDGENLELLSDIYVGNSDSEPAAFVTVEEEKVFFVAESQDIGVELWVYDLSPVSTKDREYEIFKITPTIVSDEINISLKKEITSDINISIQNSQGLIIKNYELNSSNMIQTAGWNSGLYFITLAYNNELHTFKIVKI